MNKFKEAGKKYLLEKAHVQINNLNKDQWDSSVDKTYLLLGLMTRVRSPGSMVEGEN